MSAANRTLLDAASRTLARTGFDAFSLEEAAAEAGVGVELLRAQFESREGMLRELVIASFSDVADVAGAAARQAADGPEALTRFVRAWVLHYLDRLDEFRQVMMLRQIVGGERFGVGPVEMKLVIPHVARGLDEVERKVRQHEVRELPGGIDPRRLAFGAMVTAVGLLTVKGIAIASGTPLRHADDDVLRDVSRALGATMSSMRQMAALNDAAAELARTRSEAQLHAVVPGLIRTVLGNVGAVLAMRLRSASWSRAWFTRSTRRRPRC